jgi:hypothetical protein
MSPERAAWHNMRQRCQNPKNPEYKNYGARGITVCERWSSFERFLEDMGPRPSPRHSLDRYPNNDGNYEPDNCEWRTAVEQLNNLRKNRWVTWNGRTLTTAQWGRETGINGSTIASRLDRGWTVQRALTQRHSHTHPTHCIHGHAFDEENTYIEAGARHCRTCARRRKVESYYRNREKILAYQREYHLKKKNKETSK